MAIIKPSLTFEGSDTGVLQNKTPYLRDAVRKVVFDKNNNQQGTYLYFLPAYRADNFGNGVWYKTFEIRDNFGDKYKEKYFVASRDSDPAEYFANNFRTLYREEAQVTKVVTNGKTFNKYPNFGRVTKRIVFNVAYANNLDAGVYLLDLPAANGASQLLEWLGKTDINGNRRHPINDPDRAVPVFVQLKDSGSNPWYLNVESSQPVILPPTLADSANLYNLDDVFNYKSKEDIIAKLREMYPNEVFERCMDGYPGLTRSSSASYQQTQAPRPAAPAPVAQAPVAVPAAAVQLPQAGVPINTQVPGQPMMGQPSVASPAPQGQEVTAASNLFVDPSQLPPNPMMGGMKMTKEQAERFLAQNQ